LREDYLQAPGLEERPVGYYDPENDQIGFVRFGDRGGPRDKSYTQSFYEDAAPRHQFNDAKRRKIAYTAVASSRYREYFPTEAAQAAAGLEPLDFTRRSEPVIVDVPASARPAAPSVVYVLPTFGWQRQFETNVKRSVRFGGGLRVYLERPWFSSGEGELLGVVLWSGVNGPLSVNRDKFKAHFTQWGMDPIWKTADLSYAPSTYHFPDRVSTDYAVSLEESTVRLSANEPGRMDVVGFSVHCDPERQLLFADLTIKTDFDTYMPFVRLALVRYQPHALDDARISRVVLADFAQLTPDRSALVTVDPTAPRQLRVVISGVAPRGPKAVVKSRPPLAQVADRPTEIRVRVQVHEGEIESDLAWRDAEATTAQVTPLYNAPYPGQPGLEMWAGTVTFAANRPPGRYRLLIEEYEYISANYVVTVGRGREQPGRLIYAETIELDTLPA
jgi:hypothetical protein